MEELNKTQLVLLTLLVSFVTSIATGIITSSLLQEAPTSVTQTINRVVERTIEKVTPSTSSGGTSTTVKEVTVVKEEDSIISAISKSTDSIVRISNPQSEGGGFYGIGVIVSKDGLVISDKKGLVLGATYTVALSDGQTVSATVTYVGDSDRIALFNLIKDDNHKDGFTPITLSSDDPKLGQTAIAIEGSTKNSVAIGRVTNLDDATDPNTKKKYISSIGTDISTKDEISGGPLLNLNGEIIGIKTTDENFSIKNGNYTSVAVIKKTLSKIK